jgi:putative tricarboxylic transport membrane protein
MFDVKWGLVPFDGGGDLATALIGGHVDLATREGGFYSNHPDQIRILSVANETRIKELPDVPTLEEATGKKLTYAAYRGFAVRKGTPPEVLKCLRETFNDAAQDPNIANEQFPKIGFRYEFLDAEKFAAADKEQAAIADRFKTRILGE